MRITRQSGFIFIALISLRAQLAVAQPPSTAPSTDDFFPKIAGTVVDDRTGASIPKFTIAYGTDKSIPYWKDWEKQSFSDGRFEYCAKFVQRSAFRIQVRAQGYRSAESRVIEFDEKGVALQFRLVEAPRITSVITDGDGKPLAGAAIVVATPGSSIYVRNAIVDAQYLDVIKTDEAGKFTVCMDSEKSELVIVHDAGYARVSAAEASKAKQIRLTGWGAIDCNVCLGGAPTADAQMFTEMNKSSRSDDEQPRVEFVADATTGDDGHCALAHVPAGANVVSIIDGQQMGQRERSWGSTAVRQMPVTVEAGSRVALKIGGDGRDVIGRITADNRDVPWKDSLARLYPDRTGKAEDSDWKQLILSHRAIPITVNADGTFCAVDVPPGKWRVDAMLFDKLQTVASSFEFMPYIGSATKTFEISAADDSKPFDLGTLNAKFVERLQSGQRAPDFTVKTLDGKELRLSDLRGKYVVLDFWATWCGPCVRELPELKKSWEAMKNDPSVLIVGLSSDTDEQKVRKFVSDNGYGWTHAVLGNQSIVCKSYGIVGIPRLWLVLPDGTLRGASAYGLDKLIRSYADER